MVLQAQAGLFLYLVQLLLLVVAVVAQQQLRRELLVFPVALVAEAEPHWPLREAETHHLQALCKDIPGL
jgi:hypothetical protein